MGRDALDAARRAAKLMTTTILAAAAGCAASADRVTAEVRVVLPHHLSPLVAQATAERVSLRVGPPPPTTD